LLEVLQHNEKAINLYKNAGFQVTREFDYYIANKKDINFANKKNSIGIKIKKIDIPAYQIAKTFWDSEPSWQNSFDSVYRTVHNFKILGAFSNNTLVGYGITELNTGDITQFAINKNFRRKGIATYLFYHLIGYIPGDTVKIINTDKKDVLMKFFLESLNIQPAGSQFEMIKAL